MIHKWRPTHKCIYVISEIHGNFRSLKILLDSILPLRKIKNHEDTLIFLGNYIDKGKDSKDVLDLLINIKEENCHFLMGYHETYMLKAMESEDSYRHWLSIGGDKTILCYIDHDPFSLSGKTLSSLVNPAHFNFIKNTKPYHVMDDFIFFNCGIDTSLSLDNNKSNFIANKSLAPLFLKTKEYNSQYISIANFNPTKQPYFSSKYIMLGNNAPDNLVALELNSMSCRKIKYNKKKPYTLIVKEQ
jgi:hypothetical protein